MLSKSKSKILAYKNAILKEKAKLLHAVDHKKIHAIRIFKTCRHTISNKNESIDHFLNKINKKVAEMCLMKEQLYYIMMLIELFWKSSSDKSLMRLIESSAPDHKISKERLTFLACTNAAGNIKVFEKSTFIPKI